VAPPHTGKSTIIHAYSAKLNSEEALREGRILALVVTLQANQTRKGLAQDMLKGFEKHGLETGWRSGTEATLVDRAQTYIRRKHIEIVFLDEFHHLVHSDNKSVAVSVAETINRLLIEAVVPVLMSGIEDTWKPIMPTSNSQ
jgi:Cdc6-like AAA superfamily ATPase